MHAPFVRSLAWSPTVALSWLWGLGFFYSIHVALTYGWLGFLAFAAPNAIGLFLFGYVLGSPLLNPEKIFASLQSSYVGLLLMCQLCAVAITLFGFAAYLWVPLFGSTSLVSVTLLVLVACAVGHASSLWVLRTIHMVYLCVGVAAALATLGSLWSTQSVPPLPIANFDSRFYGLALPTLAGFLLGPWLDVQQWHRVVEIRRRGESPRIAYGAGATLFAALLTINALLAAAAGAGGVAISADGVAGGQPAVSIALARSPSTTGIIGFCVWTTIASLSTIDSFYVSTRWLMTSVLRNSVSPLLTFIPASFVGSPLWVVLAAAMASAALIATNLSMMYLMLPFATLFVSGGVCLVTETLGSSRQYDAMLCTMIGLAAALIFVIGYLAPSPSFMAIAPVIGLIGATPMILEVFGVRPRSPPSPATASPPAETAAVGTPVALAGHDAGTSHGFDGDTFVVHIVPTYDDTNSVGNIYFANYVRWVGKARELFFDVCMPRFDLKTTNYFVLTRSFQHDFRREAREFERISVRIRIARNNRKFVTLAHEIYSEVNGLLGRGEQSLMFVDSVTFRPLDVPRAIIEGFLPYFPKSSSFVANRSVELAALATSEPADP